jgi:membrane protease YdiL (CAAX protease family)
MMIPPARALLAGTVAFLVGHYFFSKRPWLRRLEARASGDGLEVSAVLASKLSMGALFAGTAALVLALTDGASAMSLLPKIPVPRVAAATLALIAVLVPIVHLAAKRPRMHAAFPEARVRVWDARARRSSLLGSAVYLAGYEMLFRGLLLQPLLPQLGLFTALTIHTCLYALAHLHKDPAEAFGTVPMGYIFGWMALTDGSIWMPVLVHFLVAVTTELTAAKSREARR